MNVSYPQFTFETHNMWNSQNIYEVTTGLKKITIIYNYSITCLHCCNLLITIFFACIFHNASCYCSTFNNSSLNDIHSWTKVSIYFILCFRQRRMRILATMDQQKSHQCQSLGCLEYNIIYFLRHYHGKSIFP